MWETEALGARTNTDSVTKEIASILRARGADDANLPDVVEQSWKRCLTDYNLLPDAVPKASVLSHSEIRLRMEEREEFMRIAEPEVERLFRQLVDGEYLVSLATTEGAMVLFRCDYQYLGELAGSGVIPGSVWAEDQQGTNGVGTCLRVGKSVIIAGTQHYGSAIQRLTCLTAPVLGRGGVIESVVNVTTARQADARVNRMVQKIIERSARRIENGYFARLNRLGPMLRILEADDMADIAEEGRLALDENGSVLGASSYTTQILGQSGHDLVGQSAETLFEMDRPLSDLRPGSPLTVTYQGRKLKAVLTLPEAPRRPVQMRAGAAPPPRTEPADEAIRINPVLSRALDRARRLMQVGLPLLITGESGAGKTAFAKTVARCCHAEDRAIVFIDCAAPERQADLGSIMQRRQRGERFCILVDRIDEADDAFQTALLALLESDRQSGAPGIGLVAISTRDIDQLLTETRLRPDLIHRLNGGQVVLAPLRAVPDLEATVLDLFAMEREALGKPEAELDDDSLRMLTHHHWPGNMRELRNALRHALALADGRRVGLEHLPDSIVTRLAGKDLTARSQSEASRIEAALRYNNGNVSLTARYLGVSRATLYRKIQIRKARDEN